MRVKDKDKNAVIIPCMNKNKLDFHSPVFEIFQDWEHLPDYTIRRTASNQCLDVLLNKKRTSRKFVFPNEIRRDGDKTSIEQVNKGNNFFYSDYKGSLYQEGMKVMQHCKQGTSKWVYDPKTKQIINFEINERVKGCLTKIAIDLFMRPCDDKNTAQKWVFDTVNKGY